MARHPLVEEFRNSFSVPNSVKGHKRVIAVLYRTLAFELVKELDDSVELVNALEYLERSRSAAIRGALAPRGIGVGVAREIEERRHAAVMRGSQVEVTSE